MAARGLFYIFIISAISTVATEAFVQVRAEHKLQHTSPRHTCVTSRGNGLITSSILHRDRAFWASVSVAVTVPGS